MFNTLTIVLTRIKRLTEEERQSLRQDVNLCFLRSIEEYPEHWQVRLHPISDMQNGKTLHYTLESSQVLGTRYPTVPIVITMSQEGVTLDQWEAVRQHLLDAWNTSCTHLQEVISATLVQGIPLAEALGTRAAYERAIRELGRLTQYSQEALLILRTNTLFGEYSLAVRIYQQRKESQRENGGATSMEVHQVQSRCKAYATIIDDISEGFHLPGTVPINIERDLR